MYQKIMDKLDAQMAAKQVRQQSEIVAERIEEIIDTLDCAYGTNRKSGDYGGFILYFPTEADYLNDAQRIYEFYHINPELFEFQEIIGDKVIKGVQPFVEILFMQGSDNAITMIFPTGEADKYAV